MGSEATLKALNSAKKSKGGKQKEETDVLSSGINVPVQKTRDGEEWSPFQCWVRMKV
jgi:hypothetical protein